MVIQWDVDGVLANFQKGYHKRANEMFDTDIPLDFVPPTWDWLEHKLGTRQTRQLWENIKTKGTFWYDLDSLVAPSEWNRIYALLLGHDMYFVTSRVGRTAKYQTEDWLVDRLYRRTASVILSTRKAEIASAIQADYVIDDKAGNALMVHYQCPQAKVYILDAPYNQFSPDVMGKRVRRVPTVTQFLDDIDTRR